MYKSIILPPAKQDIRNAAKWYNGKQKGPRKKFTKQVREKIIYIRRYPEHIAIRYSDNRTAVLDIFPYMIHFSIDRKNKTIIISAVLNTYRNPKTWKTQE